MRIAAIVIAAATVTALHATSVFAQQVASYATCAKLSEERGSGLAAGHRVHVDFMDQCLAGKIPFTAGGPGGPGLTPAPQARIHAYNTCEALSEERGSGVAAGHRTHDAFMTECMAGKIH